MAGCRGLATVIRDMARQQNAIAADRLGSMGAVVQAIVHYKGELEAWFLLEIEARAKTWLDELENAAASGQNARILLKLLPPFYDVLNLPDSADRLKRLKQRSLNSLLKEKAFADALDLLRELPERQPRQEAVCHEGLGDLVAAGQAYLEAGDRKEALQCYRKVPYFERTLALLDEVDDHPAAASLRWVRDMQTLAAKRPPEFAKVMTLPEKKLLESVLEQSLGVARKKPVARKAGPARKRAIKRAKPK